MKKFYLAYGSNLNIQQMKSRCPDAKIVGTAEIKGYELLFKGSKTGSYLTIEKAENSSVPVGVWEVSDDDELRLDIYEGYPNFYYKTEMEVTINCRKIMAFVYIMHEERPIGIPSSSYVRTCVQGYRDFEFDLKHLRLAFDISERGARDEK
ncbi:MAG: gamma-glutamylcyclotransferase [Ruminococcus sp.]|nr:gamma-glutamylcyclotransferase [Ruminococcus sp.]